ncbi:MAG: hypothetical protein RL722_2515 [Pseudomonadota bacterium]|jgi:hypothetical protein
MSRGPTSFFSQLTAGRRLARLTGDAPDAAVHRAARRRFDDAMEARDRRLMQWLVMGHLAAAMTILALVYLVASQLSDRPTERLDGQQRFLAQMRQRLVQQDAPPRPAAPIVPRAMLPAPAPEVGLRPPTELAPAWARTPDLDAAAPRP